MPVFMDSFTSAINVRTYVLLLLDFGSLFPGLALGRAIPTLKIIIPP